MVNMSDNAKVADKVWVHRKNFNRTCDTIDVVPSPISTPDQFAKILVAAFSRGQGIFSNKVNVEDCVPKEFSDLDKSLFLFFVVQLDYAAKSQQLYAGANALVSKKPDFFNPGHLQDLSNLRLRDFLTRYLKPRYPNEAVQRYRVNAEMLLDKYEGNPLNILCKSRSAAEALKKIRTFRGFGPKIGNLFLRSMISLFDSPFGDIQEILPPVDIHDVRIAHLLGFVNTQSLTEKNINQVKTLWNRACRDAGVNWITFDRALWLLGSEGRPRSKQEVLGHLLPASGRLLS